MSARRHLLLAAAALGGCAAARPAGFSLAARADEVRAAETAFAKSMADRDLSAFAAWVADDAVFVNGGSPLRGKAAIVDFWQRFYAPGPAPFAWRPEVVEVVGRGDLGYSEGPVWRGSAPPHARYFSTWRREAEGRWRVVFDNGYELRRG